ncbi:MAG: hypothetical protein ACYDCY_14370, partial [Metallibacterium sp.]
SYEAANASYQAAQAAASAQSEAALWGTIAGIGQEQSLQQMMDAPAAMGFSALQMQLADTNPNSAAGEQLQAQMQQANAESFKSFLLSTGFTPPPQGPLMQAYNPAAEQAYQANLNNIAYFAAGPVLGVGIPLTRALGGSEQAAADAGEMGAGLLLGAVGVPGDAALSEVANGSAADNIVPSTTAPSVEDYVAGLYAKPTPTSTNAGLFEVEQTGPLNYRVTGGGTAIDADGYQDTMLLDAKYVGNPANSPYVDGSNVPQFLQDKIDLQQQYEFQRYQAVIADPSVPFNSLNVLTNEPAAVPYFQRLMNQYQIPGEVQVVPTNIPQTVSPKP